MARARDDSLEELFKAFPALLGRPATAAEREAFDRYADLLVLWNRTHHLTALRSRSAIARGLFLDSLLFQVLLPPGAKRVVDIGAGAGIPGVPLRIADEEMSLALVESHGRAEVLTTDVPELEGSYDFVVSRAVRLDGQFIDGAMKYLRPGGKLVTSGPPSGDPQPVVNWPGSFDWKTISFAKIGITRRFFIGSKGG